jgi:flagellar biosynthesis/type III secretory pathway chaperone
MELNDNNKYAYIRLLIDSLNKKHKLLNELMQITTTQRSIIDSGNFDEDEFLQSITLKEKLINSLAELDRGFELVYERIRIELNENRNQYTAEISALKELVTKVTELSVKLQALERMNKADVESQLANKRKSIKNARLSNETVTNYYKSMSGKQNQQSSYFYDKKK